MTVEHTIRLAVLIDGDNITSDYVSKIFDKIAEFGTATVRRIYGDWSTPYLNGWKDCLAEHSLQPVQQFANNGKNSTDIALVIDAMDLLYTGRFSGFCIVSSDGDFTRLAIRIREQGVRIYGFGERKAPRSFSGACERFVFFDEINILDEKTGTTSGARTVAEGKPATHGEKSAALAILRMAIVAVAENNRATLPRIGQYLALHAPDFKKISGYSQLQKFIEAEALGIVDIERIGESALVRLRSDSQRAA